MPVTQEIVMARILAFAGSTRSSSFNKRLVAIAAAGAAAAGGQVTTVDLRDFALPLYDGDSEAAEGMPAGARQFKALLRSHQGLLIAAPEYNSSISGVLKNAIDWASRAEAGEPPLVAFVGKVAGLLSASPGALGGLRGLVVLRMLLGNIKVMVLPEQVTVGKAQDAFGEDGQLRDAAQGAAARGIGSRLVQVVDALTPAS
jgi:chromate reductase